MARKFPPPVEDTDFIELDDSLSGVKYRDRRFVIGSNLPSHSGMVKFTSEKLGLEGGLEIAIPKSINRLRLQGSGSRFVHGGMTLEELIVPVISVNKKRSQAFSRRSMVYC